MHLYFLHYVLDYMYMALFKKRRIYLFLNVCLSVFYWAVYYHDFR